MKKKLMASVFCLCLLLIMLLGSTLAWFTEETSTVNTMVAGNVQIRQYERGADGETFLQNQKLLPAVIHQLTDGTIAREADGLWVDAHISNEITQIVTVKNTGSQAAYIRTLFAFETGVIYREGTTERYGYLHDVYLGVNGTMTFLYEDPEQTKPMLITVNGVQYALAVCTYSQPVASQQETASSLRQFFLSPDAGNEFYDLVGGQYDILVLSQAVQVQSFATADAAFDAVFPLTPANAESWFAAVE